MIKEEEEIIKQEEKFMEELITTEMGAMTNSFQI